MLTNSAGAEAPAPSRTDFSTESAISASDFASSKTTTSTVVVVGLGYVGLPLALLADKRNFNVIGLDTNLERIEKINSRQSPFADARLSEEMSASNVRATTDYRSVEDAQIIIVCVPTPVYEDHEPNLEPVIQACESIGPHLSQGQLVVIESTINPGVCEDIVLPVLERSSGLKGGVDFHLAHCPERINPGDPKWSVVNIPRVVGSLTPEGLQIALDFYRSIISAEIKPMSSLKEAEAVKIVENCFRDVNIAFVNELAMSFSKLGIDVVKVIDGASTKPFAFMAHYPGCGVGGHCIPVDPYYLIKYAKQNGFDHQFLSLARKINNNMPNFTVELLVEKLKQKNIDPKGAKVAMLGLAYKNDIDDDRESPAYKIFEHAQAQGLQVVAYDPYVAHSTAENLEHALQGARAVIVATGHREFKSLKPQDFAGYGVEIVIDGRNCLNSEDFIGSGVIYQGIGR